MDSDSYLKIRLTNEQLHKLEELAASYGLTVEELVQANLEEMLMPLDESFKQTLEYVLTKKF